MVRHYKKNLGFTVAEILVTLLIISIIAMASFGIIKIKDRYTKKLMYYSAVKNLMASVGNLIAEGCTASDVSSNYCYKIKALPYKGTSAGVRSFCNRLVEEVNTAGPDSCSTGSFTITNGQRFFNFNQDVALDDSPYTIYIDIDGTQGPGTLNNDVMAFHVYLDGTVFPVYNAGSKIGPDSTDYLTASVKYEADETTHWVAKSVTYHDAVCAATGNYDRPPYKTDCTQASSCQTYSCEVIINKP